MKTYIKIMALAAMSSFGLASCSDFLDKPVEDNYVADGYYKTDQQCLSGTSYLYSSPWSDFTRNYITVGEVLSGNYYNGSADPYQNFSVNSSDEGLGNMSASLWSVIGHCNTIYNYINSSGGPSEAVKNQTMGECLAWKAMAYFFLVRSFGEVPIVHDNSELLNSGSYNSVPKAKKADGYEYTIMTLEKAIELLPEDPIEKGRWDKAAAQGLLAKVYLTKAGVSGTINTDDLNKAASYARECLADKDHYLMDNFEDQYRLVNNINPECLVSWRWNAMNNQWTDQSFMQSDYGTEGFSEFGDIWGGWKGMSTDLQEDFGVYLADRTPDTWLNNRDKRLHGTMMLPGFTYDYFWTDKGGFDWLRFIFDPEYNPSAYYNDGKYQMETPTGAAPVKHLWGDNADHVAGVGHSAARMASSLATHILRVADVKLVLAEAKLLLANPNSPQTASTTDAEALQQINDVRGRAGLPALTTLTWDDLWKERRLELAFEGDRWYDFVRVSYYNPDYTIRQILGQKRLTIGGLSDVYSNYYKTGNWSVDKSIVKYDDTTLPIGEVNVKSLMKNDPDSGKDYFALPFTTQDIVYNPNLASDVPAEHVDVRSDYSY